MTPCGGFHIVVLAVPDLFDRFGGVRLKTDYCGNNAHLAAKLR